MGAYIKVSNGMLLCKYWGVLLAYGNNVASCITSAEGRLAGEQTPLRGEAKLLSSAMFKAYPSPTALGQHFYSLYPVCGRGSEDPLTGKQSGWPVQMEQLQLEQPL